MATATIQVAYEAETTSLKATVNEINQINDKVVQGAQESASKVKKEYTGIANSFAAAFSSGQAKKALDNQTKAIETGLYTIYDSDNRIYKQYNLFEIRSDFNDLLYEVRQDRNNNIDFSVSFDNIIP